MDINKDFRFWLTSSYFDEETKSELIKIEDNPKEIEDRFYKNLEFGTGGLRGMIGAGTNRINKYIIRKVSQGLANYILERRGEQKGIVIAYDSRYKSDEFATEAAKVFTGNGIKIYLFESLRPVPELSFTVRQLHAAAGVMITASHNPKEYNGYKVYGEDGGQMPLEWTNAVLEYINKIDDISKINVMEQEEAVQKGLLNLIGKEIDDKYIEMLKTVSIRSDLVKEVSEHMKIVYTPLHGAGNKPVRRILSEIGFKNVIVVKEQELPDPTFSTIRVPNPEERDSFNLAVKLAQKEDVDLIIGTDPDSDRVGVIVRNLESEYIPLTGNQIGCLLLEYILSQLHQGNRIPDNGFVVKTIVSSELTKDIAGNYGVELIEVLTGFKFIGEKIKQLDEFGDKKYLFGFEESYGYLAGTFVRDKDAVLSSMLIAEMAAFYKTRNMSLYEGLIELYKKYRYASEDVLSVTLKGIDGLNQIGSIMRRLRENKTDKIGKFKILAIRDYLNRKRLDFVTGGETDLELPKSDVLYYELENGNWMCIRPSGTEPKIKVYYGAYSKIKEELDILSEELKKSMARMVNPISDLGGA